MLQGGVDGFNESDLKVSHFREFAIDHDRAEEKTPQELQEWSVQGLLAVVGSGPKSATLSRNRPIGASEALKRGSLLQSDIDYNSLALRPLAVGINLGQTGVFGQVRVLSTSHLHVIALFLTPILPSPSCSLMSLSGWHRWGGILRPSSAPLAPQHAVQSTTFAESVLPKDGRRAATQPRQEAAAVTCLQSTLRGSQ